MADQRPRSLKAFPGTRKGLPVKGPASGIGLSHVDSLATQPHEGIQIRPQMIDPATQVPHRHHLAAGPTGSPQQQGRRRQRPLPFRQQALGGLSKCPVVALQEGFVTGLEIIHGSDDERRRRPGVPW